MTDYSGLPPGVTDRRRRWWAIWAIVALAFALTLGVLAGLFFMLLGLDSLDGAFHF